MCDYDSDGDGGLIIDQGLFDASRRIERRLVGNAAPDTAWSVFFGRSGGAIAWSDYQRIKQSYAKARITSRLTTGFRPSTFSCEG
jgi:hypothetical protein